MYVHSTSTPWSIPESRYIHLFSGLYFNKLRSNLIEDDKNTNMTEIMIQFEGNTLA